MSRRSDARSSVRRRRAMDHPRSLRALPLLILLVLPLAWSCARSVEERRAIFDEAERVNVEIFRGAVVRDLRAPSDSGRLVYDSAVSLHARHAQGAARVWAPFGIAEPDTTR